MSITAAPREGQPPCVRMAMLDDWLATKVDTVGCPHQHPFATRFSVDAGVIVGRDEAPVKEHSFRCWEAMPVLTLETDDEAEAEAVWERAEYWVRTGELG